MATKRKSAKPVWKKPRPKSLGKSKKLTPAQKASAKAAAKKAKPASKRSVKKAATTKTKTKKK